MRLGVRSILHRCRYFKTCIIKKILIVWIWRLDSVTHCMQIWWNVYSNMYEEKERKKTKRRCIYITNTFVNKKISATRNGSILKRDERLFIAKNNYHDNNRDYTVLRNTNETNMRKYSFIRMRWCDVAVRCLQQISTDSMFIH